MKNVIAFCPKTLIRLCRSGFKTRPLARQKETWAGLRSAPTEFFDSVAGVTNRYTTLLLQFLLLIAFVLFVRVQSSDADGGVVQVRREKGPFLITFFTAPTPLRVGLVDLSVMIQNRDNQEPVLDAQVFVQLQRKGSPTISSQATRDQANNKLLYAALVSVPMEGLWNLQVVVQHGLGSVGINNPLTVERARSPLRSYWGYFIFPFLIIALFLTHQRLKGMRFQGDL